MWGRVPLDAALQLYRRRAAPLIEVTAMVATVI
jgi:hypothetical protein